MQTQQHHQQQKEGQEEQEQEVVEVQVEEEEEEQEDLQQQQQLQQHSKFHSQGMFFIPLKEMLPLLFSHFPICSTTAQQHPLQ